MNLVICESKSKDENNQLHDAKFHRVVNLGGNKISTKIVNLDETIIQHRNTIHRERLVRLSIAVNSLLNDIES